MKIKLLLFLSFFTITVAHGQLNPVKNLTKSGFYSYPVCCGCPHFNCFEYNWTSPDPSLVDTIIGYNIYQNESLFAFVTNNSYGCMSPNSPTTCSPNWYDKIPFYVKVKAVYNFDSVTSIASDSFYVSAIAIGFEVISEKIKISVSPNPFSTQTIIQSSNPLISAKLTIYDCFGQTVKQINNINGQTVVFYRDNLVSGLYFYQLIQDYKVITTDKLLIQER